MSEWLSLNSDGAVALVSTALQFKGYMPDFFKWINSVGMGHFTKAEN